MCPPFEYVPFTELLSEASDSEEGIRLMPLSYDPEEKTEIPLVIVEDDSEEDPVSIRVTSEPLQMLSLVPLFNLSRSVNASPLLPSGSTLPATDDATEPLSDPAKSKTQNRSRSR